jgi:hypothetical protein
LETALDATPLRGNRRADQHDATGDSAVAKHSIKGSANLSAACGFRLGGADEQRASVYGDHLNTVPQPSVQAVLPPDLVNP